MTTHNGSKSAWRNRLADVATFGREQSAAAPTRRQFRRDSQAARAQRLAALHRELEELTGRRHSIDVAINAERCGFDPAESEGSRRAVSTKHATERRISEIADEIAQLSGTPKQSVMSKVFARFVVTPGSIVNIYFGDARHEVERFIIADRDQPGLDNISPASQLGAALIGRRSGEKITYSAGGTRQSATIVSIG